MIKFLADENIATSVVRALRNTGLDVKDVKESRLQGTADQDLLRLAFTESRVVITHDKDFGNVLFSKRRRHKGIVLLRLNDQRPENVIRIVLPILRSGLTKKIADNVMIISESKVVVHQHDSRTSK
ncbi:DUF5615 family PIN-like protein [Candidatus Woesearchaeota archaeon]|nr:DUF5615 family PIN-like protein [Candidatus Woesearchaeota archaeon]